MRPTNDELLMFMKAVYEQSEAKLLEPLNMWEVGESMDWDRKKTRFVYERLQYKGLLDAFALGGHFVLTVPGIEFCEESFGGAAERQENRFKFLKAVYDATDRSGTGRGNISAIGESLRLGPEETGQMCLYLAKRALIKGVGPGHVVLTHYGMDFVEKNLLDRPTLEEVAGLSEEEERFLSPHSDERRYAFFEVDIVGHSRLFERYPQAGVGQAIDAFKDFVRLEARNRGGDIGQWGGDGGLVMFPGERCEQRAFEAAQAILQGLAAFDELTPFDEALKVKIAVHTGFFAMPEDPSDIHSACVNQVAHLAESAIIPNTMLVTEDIYLELTEDQKAQLHKCAVPFESMVLYVRPPSRESSQ